MNNPFSDTAISRLQHMGLFDQAGQLIPAAFPVLARLYAGLHFDHLLDRYADPDDLRRFYRSFQTHHERGDYIWMHLCYCLQCDLLGRPLPDPIWLLAGQQDAVGVFMKAFFTALTALYSEAGFLGEESAGGREVMPLRCDKTTGRHTRRTQPNVMEEILQGKE